MTETQSKEQKLRITLGYLESINDLIHRAARKARYMYFRTDESEQLTNEFHNIWDKCDEIAEEIDSAFYIIKEALKHPDEAEE
jgi:hypothetical protein